MQNFLMECKHFIILNSIYKRVAVQRCLSEVEFQPSEARPSQPIRAEPALLSLLPLTESVTVPLHCRQCLNLFSPLIITQNDCHCHLCGKQFKKKYDIIEYFQKKKLSFGELSRKLLYFKQVLQNLKPKTN